MSVPLTESQVRQWREEGYTLAPDFLTPELLSEAVEAMSAAYPLSGNYKEEFGSDDKASFPSEKMPFINKVTTDEKLLNATAQLLGTGDIQLIQSLAWAKRGSMKTGNRLLNRDQRVHMDYGNNMWVHPPAWEAPNAVSVIIYYSDVTKTGGGTAVTPRKGRDDPLYKWPYQHMPGQNGLPFVNDREAAEEMMKEKDPEGWKLRQEAYAREIITSPTAGTVLFYRHDVWHRGTPVNVGTIRYVHNIAWVKRNSPGMCTWNAGYTKDMYYGWLEAFVRTLNGKQLRSLGWPAKDDPYWQLEANRAAVKMRYGVDLYSRL